MVEVRTAVNVGVTIRIYYPRILARCVRIREDSVDDGIWNWEVCKETGKDIEVNIANGMEVVYIVKIQTKVANIMDG